MRPLLDDKTKKQSLFFFASEKKKPDMDAIFSQSRRAFQKITFVTGIVIRQNAMLDSYG